MWQSLDQPELGKKIEKEDAVNMNLSGAQDDGSGWAGDCEPRNQKNDFKKEGKWTVFVIALMQLKFWGMVNRSAQNRRGVRPRRCLPWRASDLGLFVLVFVVLLAVCKGQFCEPPWYSNVAEMTKDLKKLTKENKQIRDTNNDLKNQITEMAEQLAELWATEQAEEARRVCEKLLFWMKRFSVWYEPLPEEE